MVRELTKSTGKLLEQKGVFFNILEEVDGTRFKLSYLQLPKSSQLIYYVRPNKTGPTLSTFNRIDVKDRVLLEKILEKSNGIKGILEKKRFLFVHGQTRIHMDKVTNLGILTLWNLQFACGQIRSDSRRGAANSKRVYENI